MKSFNFLLFFMFISLGYAQVAVTTGNVVQINFNTYAGAGFSPTLGSGQLDSDNWANTGMLDGDLTFGGTQIAGDFARGSSTGGVGTGGYYAFEVATGDFSFGIQPGTDDWTPGTATLRLVNNTGGVISKINVQYDIYVRNDKERSNSMNFLYSTDDVTYTPVSSLDYSTPVTADVFPVWTAVPKATTISGLNVTNGSFLFLRWSGDDVSGGGMRDEYAIDNILISSGDTPLPVELTSFTANAGDGKVTLNWKTASELENQGFTILRAEAEDGVFTELDSYISNDALRGAGTSSQSHSYQYIDRQVFNGSSYWYKLVDTDNNGVRTEHSVVQATPQIAELEPVRGNVPQTFALHQNMPNPFNPSTKITFDIAPLKKTASNVTVTVLNILGQKIAILFNRVVSAGTYSVLWNGKNQAGVAVPSGIYIYSIQTYGFFAMRRMVLVK